MGRFARRGQGDFRWIGRLPAMFLMEDVLASVPAEEIDAALSWLYDAIECGQVVPEQAEGRLRYRSLVSGEAEGGRDAALRR
jgi:hypothetical protein